MLFKSLPRKLRNMKGYPVEDFKACLEGVPDEPNVSNLLPRATNQVTGKASKSIVDQIRITTKAGV